MALYAVDEDDLIHAADAMTGKTYWCMDCFGPVKRRKGRLKFPHFYHLSSAPNCRLYSKTEDHMLAQIQLQKSFPKGVLQLERPFIDINRVADLCWEAEKVVFEIQCSPISPKEAEMRIRDYRCIGYEVIWLLDDKRYNKKVIRPAEALLRAHGGYYLSLRQGLNSDYYDQFELFANGKRIRRSKKILLDLKNIRNKPNVSFPEAQFPKQVIELNCKKYFCNDRTDKALRNQQLLMQNWRALEIHFAKTRKKSFRFKKWLFLFLLSPYQELLRKLLKKSMNSLYK
jgi:competence protein CoiA